MNKKVKLMKFLAVLITAIQAALTVYWIYSLYITIASASGFAPFGHGRLSYFLKKHYFLYDTDIIIRIGGSLIIPAVTFMILHCIRSILRKMSGGIKFEINQIRIVRAIALLLIIKGALLCSMNSIEEGFTIFTIFILFNFSTVLGIIILALVPIFKHGVEMQTDSDMTV